MKCMRRIALKGMRGRKKETFALIAVMFLTFFLLTTTVTLQGSFLKTSEADRFHVYGKWMGAVWNADPQDKQALKESWLTDHVGEMRVYGEMQTDSKNSAGALGALDKEALRFCGLKLQEGRLAEKKDEIAMEASALKKLGFPLETGRKVSFRLNGGREYMFTLCGILKPQSEQWETDGTALPKGYTDMSFGNSGSSCHLLFDGPDIQLLTSHEVMLKTLLGNSGGSSLNFNTRAWAPENYSLESLFQGSLILTVILSISVCVVFYILTSSLKNRKYRFVLLKSIGASAGQLCGLVSWESLYVWLYSAPAGILAGILIPIGGISLYNRTALVPVKIGLEPELMVFAVLSATAVLLLGDLYLMIAVGRIPVVPSFESGSSFLSKKRLPKKLLDDHVTVYQMMRRFRSFHWGQKIFRMGISIAAAALILGAAILAGKAISDYQVFSSAAVNDYEWQTDKPQSGLTQEDVETIRNTKGVEKVFCYRNLSASWDERIRIWWKESDDSKYVKKAYEFEGNDGNDTQAALRGMEILGLLSENKEMLRPYRESVEGGVLDEEAFWKGEEVLVYLPPYIIKDLDQVISLIPEPEDYDPDRLYVEETLKKGDMIEINTPYGNKKVKVGGILRSIKRDASLGLQFTYMNLGTIVASDTFTASFFSEPSSGNYSVVTAVVNSSADYETTDKQLTNLKTGPEVEFRNGREDNRLTLGRMLTRTALGIIFGTAIFLLYCMIMFTGQTARIQEDEGRIGILRTLGMTKKKLSAMYLWEILEECAGTLLAGGGAAVIFFACYEYWNGSSVTAAGLIKEIGSDFPWLLFGGMCLIFAFVNVLAGYVPVRKMLRERKLR